MTTSVYLAAECASPRRSSIPTQENLKPVCPMARNAFLIQPLSNSDSSQSMVPRARILFCLLVHSAYQDAILQALPLLRYFGPGRGVPLERPRCGARSVHRIFMSTLPGKLKTYGCKMSPLYLIKYAIHVYKAGICSPRRLRAAPAPGGIFQVWLLLLPALSTAQWLQRTLHASRMLGLARPSSAFPASMYVPGDSYVVPFWL